MPLLARPVRYGSPAGPQLANTMRHSGLQAIHYFIVRLHGTVQVHAVAGLCFENGSTIDDIEQARSDRAVHGGRALLRQRVIFNTDYRAVHALSFRSALDRLEPQRTSERSVGQHVSEFWRNCRIHKQTCRHRRFD